MHTLVAAIAVVLPVASSCVSHSTRAPASAPADRAAVSTDAGVEPGPAADSSAGPVPSHPLSARILRCPDLSRFDEARPKRDRDALARFVGIMRRAPIGDAPAASLMLATESSARGPVVLARGTTEQIDTVEAALAQLRTAASAVRLQCSLVTLPNGVARTHGIEPGSTVPSSSTEWTDLVRDAVKAGGSVHNFPEVRTGWLAPFEQDMPATARQPAIKLRGEVIPLGNGEVAFAIAVTHAPDQRTIATPVLRLAAGASAMMMATEGTDALVIIARCLEAGTISER